ncbi:hypothetical protein HY772_03250 [Candidatus Woesearchaeota archaeon]|nr:hypothetical protein [Candidatus Woesearchaeota archaeon]
MIDELVDAVTGKVVVDLRDPVDLEDKPKHAFPQKDVDQCYEVIERALQTWPKDLKKFYTRANHVRRVFSDTFYSFRDNLRTGNYASYPHERTDQQIVGNNCTTIIPEVYLFAEAYGLKPQIVQFIDFNDVKTKKDKEEVTSPAHFAIVLDAGRKHKYLLDPFWHIFAPIRRQTDSYWQLGRHQGRTARKREFERVVYYSAEEFAAMMGRLKYPAESLDMLVAGQKVFDLRVIQKFNCKLMVYYDDPTNTVSTRLYVPSESISDKAVYCRMKMSDEGEVESTSIDLFIAKNYGWTFLVEPKKVATTDFSGLMKVKRLVQKSINSATKKRVRLQRCDRIGNVFDSGVLKDAERMQLTALVDGFYSSLGRAGQETVHKMVLARTLYEREQTDKDFLYTETEHNERILQLRAEEVELRERTRPYDDAMWLKGWKLQKSGRAEVRKARRVQRKRDERQADLAAEVNFLNNLHQANKRAYRRMMDKVLFAKTLEGLSVEQLEARVRENRFDTRVGYLAMLSDFIPFAVDARDDLELKMYIRPIKEKVAARKSKARKVSDVVALPGASAQVDAAAADAQ